MPERGDVRVFGRQTTAIETSNDWLEVVNRFGIVSERAVLLGSLSVLQNVAMPFSLEIEPMSEPLRRQAVAVAREVRLAPELWEQNVADVGAAARLRVRLARALALEPRVILFEHPTSGLRREDVVTVARDIRTILLRRGTASLTLTADARYARAIAARVLTLEPATGRVTAGARR
jgi:phospholipid/cholesterol/gamma-HCH transport system ATP-binding protein